MLIEHDFKKVINNIENTEIKKSDIHGYGLFATKDIPNGYVMCILDGQTMEYEKVKVISQFHPDEKIKKNFSVLEWNQITNELVKVRIYPTKYIYINHFRVSNARVFQNPLRVEAIKDIKAGEEILLDYREESLGDQYLLDKGIGYL